MTADGLRARAVALVVLAVLLAVPVPAALGRARWPARSPRVALACWQAVGLAGGLSLLGAGLTLAVSGLNRGWAGGLAALPGRLSGAGPAGWAGLIFTGVAGLWLVAVTITSAGRVAAARRSLRARLELVAGDWRTASGRGARGRIGTALEAVLPAGALRVIDYPVAVAYCLPGLHPRIVVSQAAISALSPAELAAVLAHEQAHARGRHDMLIQPFVAWRKAFPFLPAAGQALRSVMLLAEMLADDAACQACGTGALRAALRRLGDERSAVGGGDAGAVTDELTRRLARLARPPRPLPAAAEAALYAVAAALILLPPVLLALT